MSCLVPWLVIFMLMADIVSTSDMYSSVAELERLYLKEQQVGQRLENFLDLIKTQTAAIDQCVITSCLLQ